MKHPMQATRNENPHPESGKVRSKLALVSYVVAPMLMPLVLIVGAAFLIQTYGL